MMYIIWLYYMVILCILYGYMVQNWKGQAEAQLGVKTMGKMSYIQCTSVEQELVYC